MSVYPKYPLRSIHDLSGMWDFAWLGDNVQIDSIKPETICYTDRMPVPGAWDASVRYIGKRGTVAYRTIVKVTPGTVGRIKLSGLGMWSRIFIDNKAVQDWACPYSGFWVDVPVSDRAERELVIVNDNRWDAQRLVLQQQRYDFYGYGGIYRAIEWHETPSLFIDRAQVRILDAQQGHIEVVVGLMGSVASSVEVFAGFDGEALGSKGILPVTSGALRFRLTVPRPRLWEMDSPTLHTIAIRIGDDVIEERFGLRSVAVKNGHICLNNKPVKLKGFCRHEAHPQFGPALPLQQIVDDLQILRDMGCNFVRGAHYPQDPRFLDLCDEMGFLVWEETLGWGDSAERLANAQFGDMQEKQARLMVRNSFNHPCVILWGFLNEGASNTPESRPLYTRLVRAIREEDSSRLVTYATMHFDNDQNLDVADVVSVNTYPGWYGADPEKVAPFDTVVPLLRGVVAAMKERFHGKKPLIISEIGAAALYGWRDRLRAHYSEEYQADLLQAACREILENPGIDGVAFWQFCDGRTYATNMALGRPRTFNNKGILDEYRRPKQAYDVVKALFTGRQ